MSKLIFIGDQVIHTKKAEYLFEMNKQELNIPFTIILSDTNRVKEVNTLFPPNVKIFCRVNFSDTTYPHYVSKICSVDKLEYELDCIIYNLKDRGINVYDIIIQEMINLTWSGAALTKNGVTLVEIVYGNLGHLLRDGIFHKRFFIDDKLNILKEELGSQTQYRDLTEDELVLKNIPKEAINEKLILDNITRDCKLNCVSK